MLKIQKYLSFIFLVCALSIAVIFPFQNVRSEVFDSSQPIEITADNLEVIQDKQRAIFTGNVVALQGSVKLKSDKMTVHYRDKEDTNANQNAVSKIEVDGHVFLVTKEETVQGSEGIYDVDKETITLSGSVVLTKGDNIVKGNHLIYNMKTGKSKISSSSGSGSKNGRVKGIFTPN